MISIKYLPGETGVATFLVRLTAEMSASLPAEYHLKANFHAVLVGWHGGTYHSKRRLLAPVRVSSHLHSAVELSLNPRGDCQELYELRHLRLCTRTVQPTTALTRRRHQDS
jgi:hypothetical protein